MFRLFVLFAVIAGEASAQTIRYSRQTTSLPHYDKLQLIPSVSGNYQVLFYKKNKPVTAYHFSPDLLFTGKTELPVKFTDNSNIRIIPFNNFYLLYAHTQGSSKHELWKINAKGEAVPLSTAFQQFIDTSFKIKTSTLQLLNQQEQLVIVSHTYYDELKILSNSIIKVDEAFKTISSYKVSFAFNRDKEHLQQATLIGKNLFLLESTIQDDEYVLQLVKADLPSGKLFRKNFSSKSNFTRNASFHFINHDSAILVSSGLEQQAFICKLDLSLKELVAPGLVHIAAIKNSTRNFLLIDDDTQQWLPMFSSIQRQGYRQNSSNGATPNNDLYNSMNMPGSLTRYDWGGSAAINNWIDLSGSYADGFSAYSPNNNNLNGLLPAEGNHHPVSFSVADKHLQLRYDTVITNQKGLATVFGSPYASILVKHKNYLILKQEFSVEKSGLLLVSTGNDQQISTKNISVLPTYEYLLGAAQTTQHETLVMPYLFKSKMGLLTLSFSQMED